MNGLEGGRPQPTVGMAEGRVDSILNTPITRRGLLKGTLAAGVGLALPNFSVPRTEASDNPLADLPPVQPTPDAGKLMESSFADQIKVTKANREKLKSADSDVFHNYFENNRSEILNARNLGLTPGEFTTDLAGALDGVTGPYYYPAVMDSEENYSAARSFGRVSLYRLPTGQALTERTVVGGVFDGIVLGVTFHNFNDNKVIIAHYGGMHEDDVWTIPGYMGYISTDGKYLSPAATFRVDSGSNDAERVFPYDIPGLPRTPQNIQAGVNELVNSINNGGGGSFSAGTSVDFDYLKSITPPEALASLDPDLTSDEVLFEMGVAGGDVMQYLQLHAAKALLNRIDKTDKQMGLVGYGPNSQTVMGKDGILQLFPDADNQDNWPKIRSSGYFLSEKRENITLDDLRGVANIGVRRMFYPQQSSDLFANLSSTPTPSK
jgi:hypothetical protein